MKIPSAFLLRGAFCARRISLVAASAAVLGLFLLATGCNNSTKPTSDVSCSSDPGTICTWAGDGVPGFDGGGHTLLKSHFYWPIDMTFAPSGQVYIVDWNNHIIREVVDGKLQTVVGNSMIGDGPLVGSGVTDLVPPGAPGYDISLNHPTEFLPLSNGKMLLMAWHNHKIRTYDPATGLVLVVCGGAPGFAGDGGKAEDALLNQPVQAALDKSGNTYILDQRNERIRKIDSNDIITTVAGTGVAGFSGDGGDPLQAQLAFPAGSNPPPTGGLVCDSQGNVYISDSLNNRVRKIDVTANTITTVAGDGTAGYGGDGGLAVNASLNNPRDLEFGPDGRLYIADEKNNRVRALDLTTGIITTVAGTGDAGFAGDGGLAVDAMLNRPAGLAFDLQGRLYIVDTYNHRIRRVTP